VVCLPWLEWAHRFHAGPIKYPASIRERIKNYLRGRIELGQDVDDIHEHFFGGRDNQGPRYRPEEWADILREVQAEEGQS
jgi:hypothetical protein